KELPREILGLVHQYGVVNWLGWGVGRGGEQLFANTLEGVVPAVSRFAVKKIANRNLGMIGHLCVNSWARGRPSPRMDDVEFLPSIQVGDLPLYLFQNRSAGTAPNGGCSLFCGLDRCYALERGV